MIALKIALLYGRDELVSKIMCLKEKGYMFKEPKVLFLGTFD